MKIDKAIFGVDDSYFLEFWPIQAKICKELLGVEPILFYICNEDSDFYHDGNGMVKKIKKVINNQNGNVINTGLLACIVRMYGTKYFPDEVCLTCDLDMLMINKDYFVNQIEKYNDDSLVIYSSDAYDLNRPESVELFNNQPFPFTQEMYNYPYNAAKGKVFNQILNTDCTFEEFVNRHSNYKPGYNFMWMIDEFYFADCVNNKNHNVEVHKLKRGYTSPWIADRRIERGNFPVQLEWEGEIEFQNKYGVYDEQKLRDGHYIDVNCCRPYSKYKNAIDNVVNIVLKKDIIETIEIKNMKKIVLISTYCDTIEKIEILKENIIKIKSFGLDVLVISPLTLPSEIIELSNFVFFTKENPLLLWPVRSFTFWNSVYTDEGWVKMHHNLADYGWAGLYQVKKLSQIALSYDYDIFYHMIYDLVIDDVVENELTNDTTNIIHPRRDPHNPDTLWETTLHFMVFDRPMMEKIVSEIELDEYLRTNGVAEGEVLKWKNKYDIPTSNQPVKDLIYYWQDTNFFNYSKNEKYKLYFNKNDDGEIWLEDGPTEGWINSKFKLFFYDVKKPINISIVINGDEYNYHIQNTRVINLDYDSTKVYEFVLFDGDIKYDYSETIKKTNRNIFYYDEIPFEIKYSHEIRVNTKDLTMVFDKDKLPFSFEFKRQINQRKIWGVELNSNAWATFPDVEMVDVIVKNNQDKLVYQKKWDINTNGNFIYKKLWNYCKHKHNSKGVVVGTHNGEFGEWVPVAIDKLSEITLVEASEKQFNELIENYSTYGNLKFINQLVTKDGGDTVFYEGGKGYTNTVVKRVIDYWETEPITETIRESIKFSELITPDVNWVHTDVEGIDFELIMSLTDKQLSHLDIIIYEYNNSSDYERKLINNFLIEKGFNTYREEGVSIAFK